jgi:hypothetical protein
LFESANACQRYGNHGRSRPGGVSFYKGRVGLARVAFRALPRPIQRRILDGIEDFRRRHPAPHSGIEDLGLAPGQVYPCGINFDDCVREGIAGQFAGLTIRKDTPVASIGSCFADEFASHMRERGFHYVSAEADRFPASANWGRVYTIPSFRQIVMYSTTDDFAMPVEHSPEGWFDPLREPRAGHFATRLEAEAAIRGHRAASRAAFAGARVLIINLGQNEAWIDRASGLAWAHRPLRVILDSAGGRFETRTFSFEENAGWLMDSIERLRGLNHGLDILLTVSPVASYATFSGAEAVTQSFAGKCILRAVVDRMTGLVPRVWYFPSFEMTLAWNPETLAADNRHVKRSTIDRIFELFHRTLVR